MSRETGRIRFVGLSNANLSLPLDSLPPVKHVSLLDLTPSFASQSHHDESLKEEDSPADPEPGNTLYPTSIPLRHELPTSLSSIPSAPPPQLSARSLELSATLISEMSDAEESSEYSGDEVESQGGYDPGIHAHDVDEDEDDDPDNMGNGNTNLLVDSSVAERDRRGHDDTELLDGSGLDLHPSAPTHVDVSRVVEDNTAETGVETEDLSTSLSSTFYEREMEWDALRRAHIETVRAEREKAELAEMRSVPSILHRHPKNRPEGMSFDEYSKTWMVERDARVQAARLRQEKEVMSEVKEKPSIGATSTRIAAHLDRPDIIRDWDYFASQHAQRRWGEPPSQYSFTPSISEFASSRKHAGPVHDRLYEEAVVLRRKKEELTESYLEEVRAKPHGRSPGIRSASTPRRRRGSCSPLAEPPTFDHSKMNSDQASDHLFHGSTYRDPSVIDPDLPVQERLFVDALFRSQSRERQAEALENLAESECTFSPTINKRSAKLVEKSNRPRTPLFQTPPASARSARSSSPRLFSESLSLSIPRTNSSPHRSGAPKNSLGEEKLNPANQRTRSPALRRSSSTGRAHSSMKDGENSSDFPSQSFAERIETTRNRKQQRIEEILEERRQKEKESCTFQPTINRTSDALQKKARARVQSNKKEAQEIPTNVKLAPGRRVHSSKDSK